MTSLHNALAAFEAEYLPSGIRETPEWQAVLAASVDTLPKGRDAQQGSVGTKGSAVPKADAQTPPPPSK